MTKTQRELAFIRDLYVEDEWTQKFTALADKHLDLSDSENLVYINAGTGAHAMALDEKFGEKVDIFASCQDEHMLNIARDKGAAISSRVDFSQIRFEPDSFDAVIADASFVRPEELEEFIDDAASLGKTGADIAIFFPGAGSYGEVFSLLWEALFAEQLADRGLAEKLIAELPTVSQIETFAERSGLVNVRIESSIEQFEYETSKEFIESPLIEDFLLPVWLESLEGNETDRVTTELTRLIDNEGDDLTFRFSVKVDLLTGEKG
jgi:hypothetical protein